MFWITKPLIWPTFNFSHHVTAWGKKLCTAVKITASSSGNSKWAVFKFRAFKKAFCDSWMDSNWANTRSKLLMYSSMDRFSYHLLPIHPFDPVLVIIYWLKNFVNMTSKNVMPLSMQIDLSQLVRGKKKGRWNNACKKGLQCNNYQVCLLCVSKAFPNPSEVRCLSKVWPYFNIGTDGDLSGI